MPDRLRWTTGPQLGDRCQVLVYTAQPWAWMPAVRWWLRSCVVEVALVSRFWQAKTLIRHAGEEDGGPLLVALDLSSLPEVVGDLGDLWPVGDWPLALVLPGSGWDVPQIEYLGRLTDAAKRLGIRMESHYDPSPAALLGWALGWWDRVDQEAGK